ncbi:MAG: hypothetical protein GY938_27110 [Ketobacter sp.]|nr:hypothetical protein [Ketobacter sp.]
MDENEIVDNGVVNHLLNAMAALDDQRTDENTSDPKRIQVFREMYGKLESVTKYIQARIVLGD